MREYPKHVATKQDYLNLLVMPEYNHQALEDLKKIFTLNDELAQIATTLIDQKDPDKGWNVKTIKNPMPLWKQKGFASKQEIAETIIANEAHYNGK